MISMKAKYTPADNSVRFVGRWNVDSFSATTTTPGAFFEIAFSGSYIILHFDVSAMSHPHPHLWICVDNGWNIEVQIDQHLRISAPDDGVHVVRVVMKSAASYAQRWYPPLDACVRFLGYDAKGNSELLTPKEAMAFVGDSITEGVFVDEDSMPGWDLCGNLVYQNDAMATYAWLASERLGYDPVILGYGSSGVTRGGLGSAPKASLAYGYCYDQKPVQYPDPKYIVINHGVNDQSDTPENFKFEYLELLNAIDQVHPSSKIILLQPFCGLWEQELRQLANEYSQRTGSFVRYISTEGWYGNGPLHPYRDGHRQIAEKLVEVIRKLESGEDVE